MLDPRIYRTGLIVAALALVVLAFSLRSQPGAMSPTVSPEAFDGANVANGMSAITSGDPVRAPGSAGDDALATEVVKAFKKDKLNPSTDTFSARTSDGVRVLENVVGVLPGSTQKPSLVIVAPRDTSGAGSTQSASATAMLLELARVLRGETLQRTVVLASTSGSQGTAGAVRLASTMDGSVDAVLVLGDVASTRIRQPIVIPWSMARSIAPPQLRNTLVSALASQASLRTTGIGLGGQFAHLALPFTLGQQAPFVARGIPAVELSVSGERGPDPGAPTAGPSQITGIGRAVLSAISALDAGSTVQRPSAYLLLDGKVVPAWSLSLFVLALLVPVALTAVDGVARARRRGHAVWRSTGLVLATAAPFVLAVAVVVLARLIGAIGVAPPGPVAPGAVALDGAGAAVLILAALAILGGAAAIWSLARHTSTRSRAARERVVRRAGRQRAAEPGLRSAFERAPAPESGVADTTADGALPGLVVVLCAATFAVWLRNPYAALLLVPALHLWPWAVNSELRLPLPARLALVGVGLVPPALVVIYYAHGFGFGPLGLAWEGALMLAGHGVSATAAIEWCVVAGCALTAATLAVLATRRPQATVAPVTVRGPVTYAGPGSLGGTESALRR
ncbi:MAG: M28 family peptidase [Solirubrobacteraceae bacterium]